MFYIITHLYFHRINACHHKKQIYAFFSLTSKCITNFINGNTILIRHLYVVGEHLNACHT